MAAHSCVIHEPGIVSKNKEYVFTCICILKHYVHIYVYTHTIIQTSTELLPKYTFSKSKCKILSAMLI